MNPNIWIKVNTVVNSANLDDNLAPQIRAWSVDHWKFLRYMQFSDGVHDNAHMVISDAEYTAYMQRLLKQFNADYVPEQYRYIVRETMIVAERTLAGSYIMVDPTAAWLTIRRIPLTPGSRTFGKRTSVKG